MVSVNPNPAQGFFFFDPVNMGHPSLNSLPPTTNNTTATAAVNTTAAAASATKSASSNTMSFAEDQNKKIRKPYTITKSRESWTEQEHDKFLEALQLFDRDWKKIEAFIGSKTVIQIRSHAQKYFLKVQKNGTSEHVPPPRPKRKAAHPYPQKAPKNAAPVVSQVAGPFQSSSALLEPAYVYGTDSSSGLGNPIPSATLSSWSYNSMPPVSAPQVTKGDMGLAGPNISQNCCYSSSNESTPRTWPVGETIDPDHGKPMRVTPDFAQVYNFIGSVFDPGATDHMQKLKQMDPINLETALLLMRNLAINLTNPEFEDHKKLLTLYEADSERAKFASSYDNLHIAKSESVIPSA